MKGHKPHQEKRKQTKKPHQEKGKKKKGPSNRLKTSRLIKSG